MMVVVDENLNCIWKERDGYKKYCINRFTRFNNLALRERERF